MKKTGEKKNTESRRAVLKKIGAVAAGTGLAFSDTSDIMARPHFKPLMEGELEGKVAIITGSRNNLGRGFAVALAEAGASIVVHHHTPDTRDQAEETAHLVMKAGGKAIIAVGDLGQVSVIERMFDLAENEFGGIDILINNAGQIVKKPLAEISEEEFDRLANINLRGTFFCMREASRRLADNGRVINIGTSIFTSIVPNYAAYTGTKAGMEEFTRALTKEVGNRGITVNVVCPGPVDTPFFHGQETPQSVAYISKLSVAGRLGVVDDIVPIVAFLASPGSQWITGQTFWVNGGYTTR